MLKLHLKQTLLFSFLLIYASAFAQLTLEATYPTANLQRLKLPSKGEVWYFADDSARQIQLFDANHSLWKTVNYPSEANNKIILAPMNLPVSQTTFKADNLLEFVWLFQDTINRKERIKVLNERGDSIFYFPFNQTKITVNELINRPTNLFFEKQEANGTYSTTVYGLPNIILEKIYPKASNFHRQIFGFAGEVYYFKNTPDKRIEIYYPNHNLLKSKPLAVPTNGGYTTDYDPYFFADDKMFNADSLVEVVFSYVMNSTDQVRIANENKTVLFHSNFFSSFKIDRIIGHPDKLFWNYSPSVSANNQCRVISLPFPFTYPSTTPREMTYDVDIERIVLSRFGAKYLYRLYTKTIILYDTNHIFWKSISLISNTNYYPYYSVPHISDNIVNQDSVIEVIWIEKNYSTTPNAYQLRITDERKNNIATIPNAYHFEVNQSDSLPTKLVTKMTNGMTKVWRFTTRTATQEVLSKDLEVLVSPNPFVTSFRIHNNNSEGPLSIRLFNAIGQLVFSEKNVQNDATITPPPYLSKGVYILEISNENNHSVQRLIKL
jgi:hypothetical protein